jgi:hypothetical protein
MKDIHGNPLACGDIISTHAGTLMIISQIAVDNSAGHGAVAHCIDLATRVFIDIRLIVAGAAKKGI